MKTGTKEHQAFERGANLLLNAYPDEENQKVLKTALEKLDRQTIIRMLDKLQNNILDIKVELMVHKDEN